MCVGCEQCVFQIPEVHKGFEISYEIHITIKYSEQAIAYCNGAGIKLINIDLGDKIPKQLMTSVQMKGLYDRDIMPKVQDLKSKLQRYGVLRTKIETSLNHPYAVDTTRNLYVGENYYEVHFVYEVDKTPTFRQAFAYDFHISTNAMKTGTSAKRMLTKRFSKLTSSAQFIHEVEILKNIFNPDKVIMEYCLRDDRQQLDQDWLNNDLDIDAGDPIWMEHNS